MVRTGVRVVRLESGQALLKDGGAISFDLFVNPTGLASIRWSGTAASALRVDAHLRFVADPVMHRIDGHFLRR